MVALKGKLLRIYEWATNKWDITDSDALLVLEEVINYFSLHDPSKTNKYVQSMLTIFMEENVDQTEIVATIIKFHSLQHKLSPKIFNDDSPYYSAILGGIVKNPKDITFYEQHSQFTLVIEFAENFESNSEKKSKVIDNETDIIYDKDDYLIVSPLSFKSSCYWGVDTKWCTTSKDNPDYFTNYTNEGILVYVIDKYRQNDINNPMSKYAIYIKDRDQGVSIYNRPDALIGGNMSLFLPNDIKNIIIKYQKSTGILTSDAFKACVKTFIRKCTTMLFNGDSWYQITNADKNDLRLSCHKFPSYRCIISFKYDQGAKYHSTVQWLDHKGGLVASIESKEIDSRQLQRHNKDNTMITMFADVIGDVVNIPSRYYFVQRLILNSIIVNSVKEELSDLSWTFKFLKHEPQKPAIAPNDDPAIITELGCYNLIIYGDFADLTTYNIQASIDFSRSLFILPAGETNELTWETYVGPFQLLYYTEAGMVTLLHQFKSWVIDIITTKSEAIKFDLYDDIALNIQSKRTSFEDYLL